MTFINYSLIYNLNSVSFTRYNLQHTIQILRYNVAITKDWNDTVFDITCKNKKSRSSLINLASIIFSSSTL